ncbi:hypothetical protein C5B85_11760 [Pseudoclavibacter sp. AY1F1]|uniref:TRAFAC clade GTPase domain-containing protein n=1 Tax=Pseudoclavibacter sp. AY1F1 TaxID=2080583 RepID=UPI000CE89D81|nr:hypothetical protein [Pseudoclavibacter sp. AY1F1]PPF43819.1 hypothetical protein C5B85_11760 [Pseudoclavibacter sp. AY1F1]
MPYVIAFIIGAIIVVFLIWIVVVVVARILGFVIGYAIIVAALAFVVGLVWGNVLPIRLLRGKSQTVSQVASPSAVVAGDVFSGPPRGASANFGWDAAWPVYVPYQLHLDQGGVLTETKRLTGAIHMGSSRAWPVGEHLAVKAVSRVLWFVVLGIPTFGLTLGIWTGSLLWLVISALFRLVVSVSQRLASFFLRQRELRHMKSSNALVRCTHCYRETDMPSFRCSDPSCARTHRDMAPGPLGIRTRICECAEALPLTVARASRALIALCPHCEKELPSGSGTRRVVVIPVFGTVGSGKTQFLAASAVGLHDKHLDSTDDLRLTPLSGTADQFLMNSVEESDAGRAPLKTQRLERPEGLPFEVSYAGATFELHLMDAAGENFVRAEGSRSLGYLDISNTLVFILDPLSIEDVNQQLKLHPVASSAEVAQGSPNDSYGSVVDRLRDDGVNLGKRKLAVVLTKTDIASQVFAGDPVPHESDGIRNWLTAHGGDRLARRIEMDFTNVRYFAVDSVHRQPEDAPLNPLRVIDWTVLNHGGAAISSVASPETPVAVESEVRA